MRSQKWWVDSDIHCFNISWRYLQTRNGQNCWRLLEYYRNSIFWRNLIHFFDFYGWNPLYRIIIHHNPYTIILVNPNMIFHKGDLKMSWIHVNPWTLGSYPFKACKLRHIFDFSVLQYVDGDRIPSTNWPKAKHKGKARAFQHESVTLPEFHVIFLCLKMRCTPLSWAILIGTTVIG